MTLPVEGRAAASRRAAFDLADRAVTTIADLDPCCATELGIVFEDGRLTDYGPDGIADRHAAVEALRADNASLLTGLDDPADTCVEVLEERLGVQSDMSRAGDHLCEVNVLSSPPHCIRMSLELLPPDTDPATLAGRLRGVAPSLGSWRAALEQGIVEGRTAARRQALAVGDQLRVFADEWLRSFLRPWVESHPGSASALLEAGRVASAGFRDTGIWLTDVYSRETQEDDAVGPDVYSRKARAWLGDDVDLLETFEWGWDELERIVAEMDEEAGRVVPGGTPMDAKQRLDTDPDYLIEGENALTEYLCDLTARATHDLDGRMFEIDREIRACDVRIAPEGSAATPYYVPPSEDLSRPGSTWYPTMGRTVFPRWWLVSVWYHEGVPGHHLQFGTTALQRADLSRFQRTFGWTAGHGEGWALYAERLMDELGYLEDPGLRLGYLSAQALRTIRVVVDIGMHLGLDVPSGRPGAGRPITSAFARQLLRERALLDDAFACSEVDRYLGLPGQAISYKVGERVWLSLRERARRRAGDGFDLKDWHMKGLRLGPMGLGPFRCRLDRAGS